LFIYQHLLAAIMNDVCGSLTQVAKKSRRIEVESNRISSPKRIWVHS